MKIALGTTLLAGIALILVTNSANQAQASAQASCGNLNKTEALWAGPGFDQNVNSPTNIDVQGSTLNFTVGSS